MFSNGIKAVIELFSTCLELHNEIPGQYAGLKLCKLNKVYLRKAANTQVYSTCMDS